MKLTLLYVKDEKYLHQFLKHLNKSIKDNGNQYYFLGKRKKKGVASNDHVPSAYMKRKGFSEHNQLRNKIKYFYFFEKGENDLLRFAIHASRLNQI